LIPIRDTVPSRHPPVIVWVLLLINGVVFTLELALPEAGLERAFYLFGLVPKRFTHPEWARYIGFPIHTYWPFLTHMFLHAGWLHIIGNMWVLWIFGDNVEDRMGPARFLIFYLLCGLTAGVTQMFVTPNATVPSVGASGAIAGVMGAYLLMFPTARVIVLVPIFFFPLFFELPAVLYLVFWFWIQLFSGALALAKPDQVGGIAFWAHVGGFVAGVVLHRLFLMRQPRRHRFEPDERAVEDSWVRRRSR
jgi:membrane associated rhomboid family serine protease